MAPRRKKSCPESRRRARAPNRGAVLIVALLLAAMIAISLGSYLNLTLSSTRLAKRSFKAYAALNLAEAGAEEAVWSFNQKQRGDATAWEKWNNRGSSAWQKFEDFKFGHNTRGWTKVYVDNFNPGSTGRPKVYVQSSVESDDDTAVVKMLEVTLRRRSLFASGMVAKDSVAFAGAVASVDSWNSDPDNNPATPAIPYDPSIRKDGGTVGSVSVVNSAILVNQADIWGYVATGGGQPEVGNNGTIRGASTPAGIKVDPRRISTDFNADFDGVLTPVDGVLALPLPATLGTAGMKTRWRTPTITLTAAETLTILGDVTLVLTAGTGTDSVSITGTSSIIIPDGSSLTIYAEGHVRIAGKGLANTNAQPISCQIYGVNPGPGGQDIEILGNGALKCVVYAPYGDVKIAGNGDVMGSIIARSIKLTGNAAFHYDEALAERDSNQPFSIAKWRELTTASDRARFAPLFQGW